MTELKQILITTDSLQAIKPFISKTPVTYLAAWAYNEMRKARLEEVWVLEHSENFYNKVEDGVGRHPDSPSCLF